MVKDHSGSETGNPLPPHRLLFPINSKVFFICIFMFNISVSVDSLGKILITHSAVNK